MTTNNAVNVGLSGSTGTGSFVGSTSPTLVTPALGTPASGVLTNMTGTQKGVTDASNAASGQVGELIISTISQGSAVSLSNGVPANITSISLTAGDWDVIGNVVIIPASTTIVTALYGGISLTSASLPATSDRGQLFLSAGTTGDGANTLGVIAPLSRVSITTTTTIYLVAFSDFTVSTNSGFGYIRARRIR